LFKFAEHSNRFGGWGRGGDNYYYGARGDHHDRHGRGGDDRRGDDRR
jgi:hypothetical protein